MEIGEGPAGGAVAAEERVSLIKLKQSVRRAAGETQGSVGTDDGESWMLEAP